MLHYPTEVSHEGKRYEADPIPIRSRRWVGQLAVLWLLLELANPADGSRGGGAGLLTYILLSTDLGT